MARRSPPENGSSAIDKRSRSEQAARWLEEKGGTLQATATRFNVSRQAVQQAWVRVFANRPTPKKDATSQLHLAVRAAQRDGLTAREAAAKLNISKVRLYRIGAVYQLQWAHIHRVRDTDAMQAVAQGMTVMEAAVQYEMSERTLRRLLTVAGIRSRATGKGRQNGSSLRAIERVKAGASVRDACRIERCSTSVVYTSPVYKEWKRRQAKAK